MTTRQLMRLFHEAVDAPPNARKTLTLHVLRPRLCNASARTRHRYPRRSGALGSRQTRRYGPLYPRRHRHDRQHRGPLRPADATEQEAEEQEGSAAGVIPTAMSVPALEVADIFRDHGAAWRSANAGHLSLDQLKVMDHRALSYRSAWRPCGALRGLCAHRHHLRQLPQPALPQVPGRRRKAVAGRTRGQAAAGALLGVVFTLPEPIAAVAYQNKAVIYDLLFKAAAEATLTIAADPKHLGARSASPPYSTPGARPWRVRHLRVVRARRRLVARRQRLACGPASFCRCACSRACSAAGSSSKCSRTRTRPAASRSFRRPRCTRQRRSIRRRADAAAQGRVGGLRQEAVPADRRPCSLIWRATPIGSPSPTAG